MSDLGGWGHKGGGVSDIDTFLVHHGFTAASEWETSQCLSYNILALGKFFEYSIDLNFYGIFKYDTKIFQNIEYVKK